MSNDAAFDARHLVGDVDFVKLRLFAGDTDEGDARQRAVDGKGGVRECGRLQIMQYEIPGNQQGRFSTGKFAVLRPCAVEQFDHGIQVIPADRTIDNRIRVVSGRCAGGVGCVDRSHDAIAP